MTVFGWGRLEKTVIKKKGACNAYFDRMKAFDDLSSLDFAGLAEGMC